MRLVIHGTREASWSTMTHGTSLNVRHWWSYGLWFSCDLCHKLWGAIVISRNTMCLPHGLTIWSCWFAAPPPNWYEYSFPVTADLGNAILLKDHVAYSRPHGERKEVPPFHPRLRRLRSLSNIPNLQLQGRYSVRTSFGKGPWKVNCWTEGGWFKLSSSFFSYELFSLVFFVTNPRLLQETSAGLKQKQDNLAAQLQVAQEQKSRLQSQVDKEFKSLKVLKDEYVGFR